MTNILIIEGNAPATVAGGLNASEAFVGTLHTLAPDITCRITAPFVTPLTDAAFADINGVIFTGSAEAWSVDAPEIEPFRTAMELAFGTGLPVWGSCNGLQLAAVVMGGAVGASPNGIEIGVARDITLTDAGRSHPAMQGRADGFAAPCVHRDEVQRLPTGAVLLAGNAHSPVQAMAIEHGGVDFWGTQYHPELSAGDIADYIRNRGIYSRFDNLRSDLETAETHAPAAARLGTTPQAMSFAARARELGNWLAHVKARKARHTNA